MEGYLDHLETTGYVGQHKKVWMRRFFKLNSTFHVLEFFTDASQHERKGKWEMKGAVVSTADEMGSLLSDDTKAVEMSRRFIFRITENGSKKHHYLCTSPSGEKSSASPTYALTLSTREYMEEWVRALRETIVAHEESPLSAVTMGLGELNAQIGIFMNRMHLSAHISNRIHEHGKSIYEITVKAWVLQRELVMQEQESDYRGQGPVGSRDMSWQVLEYSCAWKIRKSTAELRNFDGQLRLFFGSSMQHFAFPSSSIGTKLQQFHVHASASQKQTENLQRMQVYDAYLQLLLHLPEFSSKGSDASTMLDTFLDISPHLISFRKLEKQSGRSMHLRDRKVVPWKDRERFEVVYKMHLQVIAAQEEEKARRVQMAQSASASASRESSRTSHRHRQSRHQHHQEKNGLDYNTEDTFILTNVEADVVPLPAPANHHYRHRQERKDLDHITEEVFVPINVAANVVAPVNHYHRQDGNVLDHTTEKAFVQTSVAANVAPLTSPAMLNVAIEEERPVELIQERIARIGHRLVIEAFEA